MQKTAYEMRISDWSSDVCSSDLAGAVRLQLDARQLGDAVDQPQHILAEILLDLGRCRDGVFEGVVQQAGGDGGAVELHAGEDAGDFHGRGEIRIARDRKIGGLGKRVAVGVVVGGRGTYKKNKK